MNYSTNTSAVMAYFFRMPVYQLNSNIKFSFQAAAKTTVSESLHTLQDSS